MKIKYVIIFALILVCIFISCKNNNDVVADEYVVEANRDYKAILLQDTVVKERPNITSQTLGMLKMNSVIYITHKRNKMDIIQGKKGIWYKIKTDQKSGWIFSKNMILGVVKHGEYFYGVYENITGEYIDEVYEKIYKNSHIAVYSIKNKKVIQRKALRNTYETLTLNIDNQFSNIYKGSLLSVEHCPDSMANGFKLFKLDKDGRVKGLFISWYKEIGAQDEPYADLKNMLIDKDLLTFEYEYYETVGVPALGYGKIFITYKYNNNLEKYIFNNIKSDIIITHRIIDGVYSDTDEYKYDKPKKIIFTRNSLNSKFKSPNSKFNFIE